MPKAWSNKWIMKQMSRSKHGYPSYDMNTNNTYLLSDLCLAFIVIEVSPVTQTVMTEYIYIFYFVGSTFVLTVNIYIKLSRINLRLLNLEVKQVFH